MKDGLAVLQVRRVEGRTLVLEAPTDVPVATTTVMT